MDVTRAWDLDDRAFSPGWQRRESTRRRPSVDYRGQVAVVTGASAGLGRQLVMDLARAGALVISLARREEPLRALVAEVRAWSPESKYRVCDLAEAGAFVTELEQIESEFGRIDLLFNVAGIGGIMRTEPLSSGALDLIMEVNFFAPVRGMLTVLPGMRRRRSGAIANVSSDDARAPGPGAADYAASKAALSAATESLAYATSSDGVYLHVVYPGWMPTEMGLKAVREGGMRSPPRLVRHSAMEVSALVLDRMYDPRVEINTAALPLVAPLLRSLAPRIYQRMRAAG